MFKLIRGITVDDTILIASDVPEDDEAEWNSASTPYTSGAEVMVTTTANGASKATHRIYKSTASSNNEDPTLRTTYTSGGEDVFWWKDASATNRYKMFDPVVQDQTVQEDGLEVTLSSATTFVTGIGFLNVNAASIDLVIESDSVEIFSENYPMQEPVSTSGFWWWLFEPIAAKTSLYIDNLPTILGVDITATFNGAGNVACGIMSIGESVAIGESVYGVNYSIISYSQKREVDGRITITTGNYRDVVDVPVVVYASAVSNINRVLNENRDVPAVWFVGEDYPLVYGFYDRYDMMISNPSFSELTIRIEGLV
jgi:hypothetical protein